jgi:hypothetical protein
MKKKQKEPTREALRAIPTITQREMIESLKQGAGDGVQRARD